ncbi:SDR family NAD(P)-dependent oxidoreductase [Erythrobacteraceae bacterium CFH 75059]|uniref:SDR family NAD(P)-dependent oxidoreductase n=1 Tax=Qipengyuania thermophila TaxID=2509361 RepID=UPI00101F3289|nr:SDR family NAD(P)-dependent oxidoreductase [Qipengyuania thermophila]TCD05118.1 SDR family NAD(P)-dependent oxidoreductase [Erythrobacteraceae bacterium CFH 75059]
MTGWPRAVVVGASGGIGSALVARLESAGTEVAGFSRAGGGALPPLDLTDEASIAGAAQWCAESGPWHLVIVATGILDGRQCSPEKSWRQIEPAGMAESFAINATGPALVAKHFLPLLPRRGRSAFAALSARVGSISDNRLGGWYGYRASKAALNMIIRSLAIELARTRPDAFCVGLHPGTVATKLSRPHRRSGAGHHVFSPEDAAGHLLDVLDTLQPADTGRIYGWDGVEIAP